MRSAYDIGDTTVTLVFFFPTTLLESLIITTIDEL